MLAIRAFILALPACTAITPRLSAQPPDPRSPVALERAAVVDVAAGRVVRDQTVVIRGTRVVAVGRSTEVRIPADARRVDAGGRYLIPGLWDMHVHVRQYADAIYPLLVAQGVTGVRDMFQPLGLDTVLAWRREIAAGTRLGPRIVAAGPLVDGPTPVWPGSVAVATSDRGRRVVDSLRRAGSDFIKVYSLLPREPYLAIAAEARRRAIPFVGHLPAAVSAAEASDAGQRSVEHLGGVELGCSRRERELLGTLAAATSAADPVAAWGAALRSVTAAARESYDAGRCAALMTRFARNGTRLVPTVVLAYGGAHEDSLTTAPERWRYVPAEVRDAWARQRADVRRALAGPDSAARRRAYEAAVRVVGAARAAGVSVLAGTDASPIRPVVPGFALHDELALLARAGYTPLEVLRAATIDAARFFGASDSLGIVAPGKLADLVLLDADPLVDIRNTRRIQAVVTNGRYLDRLALDSVLAAVQRRSSDARDAVSRRTPRQGAR